MSLANTHFHTLSSNTSIILDIEVFMESYQTRLKVLKPNSCFVLIAVHQDVAFSVLKHNSLISSLCFFFLVVFFVCQMCDSISSI